MIDSVNLLNLDYDLSLEVFNKCKRHMKKKECYSNVAYSFLEYVDFIEKFKDVEISFGGFNPIPNIGGDNLFYKHCFFILGNKVIDPTLILLLEDTEYGKQEIEEKSLYFNIISYDKEEYKKKLIDCSMETSLGKYTNRIMNKFQNDLIINNPNDNNRIILIG